MQVTQWKKQKQAEFQFGSFSGITSGGFSTHSIVFAILKWKLNELFRSPSIDSWKIASQSLKSSRNRHSSFHWASINITTMCYSERREWMVTARFIHCIEIRNISYTYISITYITWYKYGSVWFSFALVQTRNILLEAKSITIHEQSSKKAGDGVPLLVFS